MKTRLSVPSKVFIIGEYAVLEGAPAVVSTFAPRFTLGPRGMIASVKEEIFHPDSPAGRLIKANRWEGIWEFLDPYQGAGGFGGSTAEFLLAYAVSQIKSDILIQAEDAWKAWARYLDFTPKASGADLIAQWLGGTVLVNLTKQSAQTLDLRTAGKCLLVFSAAHQEDRKVKTHEHLNKMDSKFKNSSYLKLLIERAIDAITKDDVRQLASSLNQYGDSLKELGLEIPETSADREALMKVPGVIGVKGTGALQADGIIVVMDPAEFDRKDGIVQAAHQRDLRCLARQIVKEPGIVVE